MSSNPSIIARTQPIAIAARKPAHAQPVYESSNIGGVKHNGRLSASASMSSTTSAESSTNTRSRKDRPCDACRRRKSRCQINEGQSSCVSCLFHKQECTFVQSPQPRKRKLVNDGREDASAPKRRSPDRDNEPRRRPTESLSSNGIASSLIEEMANIGGPTLLKRSLGLQKDRYSQYIGPTTDFEPSLIELSTFDTQDESLLSRGTLRKVSEIDTFLMLPDHNTEGYSHVIEDVDAVENIVTPHGPALLDLYFRVIHPNFPILQKTVFMEKYNRSHREFSPSILAAVYILAINWWDHSEELSSHPKPDLQELERLARVTLQDAMYRPKLSTVQAGLLLSQRPEGDQWAPTAQLIAIGQELGLHLDCSQWKIPIWERGLRKRLAWALYMQDKWGALVHGRPSHIFAANWAVSALVPSDFPEGDADETSDEDRADYERGMNLFTQMINLSMISAEVLETFYTLQAMAAVTAAGNQGTQLVLTLAKPVQLKLKEWYSALPANLKMDSATIITNSSSRLSSIGFLHLAYFATEITLHRRIIRSLSHPPNVDVKPTLDPYIIHICRSAAKTRLISAMDFVNRLTTSHLRSFWYFASKTNFALIGTFGSLLWATAPGREEADWYRRRLSEYRWTLAVSCKGGSEDGASGNARLTRFAMDMLDTSTGLLKSLPEKPSLSRVSSEVEIAQQRQRQRSIVEGSYGSYGTNGPSSFGFASGAGFSIGAPRDRDDQSVDLESSSGMRSGLASPSTSVSSSGEEQGFEGFNARAGFGIGGGANGH